MNQSVNYMEIAYSAPVGLKQKKKPRNITFPAALLFFIVLMAAVEGICTVIGLFLPDMAILTLLQELFFLAGCILYVKARHVILREVFRIRKPKAAGIFGAILMAFASYLAAVVISEWTYWISPSGSDAIESMMESSLGSALMQVLLVVIVPPICEEVLHRGVLLEGCRNSFKNKWTIVIVEGLLFGFFHIYPIRWAAPMLLGGILAWIVLKSDNMIYSSIVHAAYNGIILLQSVLSSVLFGAAADSAVQSSAITLTAGQVGAATLFYGIPVPILIYTAGFLIRTVSDPRKASFFQTGKERTNLLQIFVPTFIILGIGLLLIISAF